MVILALGALTAAQYGPQNELVESHFVFFWRHVSLQLRFPTLSVGWIGHPFQSPFAKPPGQGLSSSTVNVMWGVFNIAVAYIRICRIEDFSLRSTAMRQLLS